MPLTKKEALVHPFLKKTFLDPTILDNYHPISKLLFLDILTKKMVSLQLQKKPGGCILSRSVSVRFQVGIQY